jgi:hypothetical protein
MASMGPREPEDLRTMRLHRGQRLRLESYRITCCAGKILIRREDDPRGVILLAGENTIFSATAVVTAVEGMRDEWLEDTGIVVIALSKVPA